MKNRWSPVRPSITGRLLAQRKVISLVGDREARQIADVFAQGKAAVDFETGERFEGIVLRGECVAAFIEFHAIGRGPPLAEIAGAIPLRTLVVESVPDFMADHGADAAVIHGIVGREVEKGGCRIAAGKVISFWLAL